MEIEIYETLIGIFRMITDLEHAQLVQVQLYVPGHEGAGWENVGRMRRKEFFKMIRPHNPKKRDIEPNRDKAPDQFWSSLVKL
jgi:hypothetical protein